MKRIAIVLFLLSSFVFSGCTVAHFIYVRNLSDGPVEISFVFSQEASIHLRDSMYVPYSPTSHLINKNTSGYMTDSIVAKKVSLKKMKIVLPSGSMVMFDKITSKKISYYDPEKMEVFRPSTGTTEEVFFTSASGDAKQFKVKGRMPVSHWYDIY